MTDADRTALDSWLRAQDPDAFKTIVTCYAGMVYGTCLRILRNPTDAEDVTQESFVALAYVRDSHKVRSLGAWLHQVATHLALRRIRTDARLEARDARYAKGTPAATEQRHDDVMRHVDEAIATLPEQLRVPLVAYYLHDRTQAAIAEELGVSRQLVTHRVAKGLEQVRNALRRRGIVASATVVGTMLAQSANADVPATLTVALGKTGLGGSAAAPAPYIAATVAAMGNVGAVAGLVASKVIAITAAVILAVCLGMAATCERPATPSVVASESSNAPPPSPAPDAVESPSASAPASESPQSDPVETAYELRMAGKLDEAKALLQATTEQNPSNARAYFELARTAMHGLLPQEPVTDRKAAERRMSEDAKLAGWAMLKAVQADPENAYYRYWEGLIATYSAVGSVHSIWQLPGVPGRISDSIHAFEVALELDPNFHEVRYELAGLYDRLPFYLGGSKKKFKTHYADLQVRSPVWAARLESSRPVNDETRDQRLEKRMKSVSRWQELVQTFPNDPEAHEGLARAHLRLYREGVDSEQHADAAWEHITAALALDPSRVDTLFEYGGATYSKEDYARAEASVHRLLALNPVAPVAAKALDFLALVRGKQSRIDEAKHLHAEALATHPILDFPGIPARELFSPPE